MYYVLKIEDREISKMYFDLLKDEFPRLTREFEGPYLFKYISYHPDNEQYEATICGSNGDIEETEIYDFNEFRQIINELSPQN